MMTIITIIIIPTTTTTMPRAAVDVIREPITLCEWLGHMTLYHANVQICNDSVRTIYIFMRVESRADVFAPAVQLHALEPDYSRLYSIPREKQLARITIALGEPDNDSGGCTNRFITLRSNFCLLCGERLRVTDCCC
jgi:hypothetical protein